VRLRFLAVALRRRSSSMQPVLRGALALLAAVGAASSCADDASDPEEPLGTAQQAASVAPLGDTYVELTTLNANHGAEQVLEIQGLRQSRSLVRFDDAEITAAMAGWPLTTATLEVTLASAPSTIWGSGHLVDVHRMLRSWTESGATGVCPIDTDPANALPD
jgi:hypothetical protein